MSKKQISRRDFLKGIGQMAVAAALAIMLTVTLPDQVLAADVLSPPQPMGWVTTTAYDLKVAFWTGFEPHFGAFFIGSYGHDQHYLGPGGDGATCGSSAGCISGWNWWGTFSSVLLVPKGGWLFTEPPWGQKWQPNNYQATMLIN